MPVTLKIKSATTSSKVTLGTLAGNVNQQSRGVAIGYSAGQTNQGANAIAIGAYAAPENQPSNSIVLNASGNSVQTSNAGVYINPMRTLVHSSNVVVYTANELSVGTTNITVPGSITAASFIGDGSQVTLAPKPTLTISNVQITDSSYSVLDDTAISTDNGGFCLVNGTGYTPGCIVMIGTTFASSISYVSQTQLRVQVPAKASGSYNVTVIRGDTETATRIVGITYSPFPVWNTSATLVNVNKYSTFTYSLNATSDSNVTYFGGSLPPGTTLTSSGTFSGNITDDVSNTTTYSFLVDAIDQQMQNIGRTFGLTALGGYPRSISGLVGWYDGSSWTGTQWTDKSGIGNHAVSIRGTVGASAINGLPILTGATTAGIKFPIAILPSTYTLFHVAKYNGATKQRIFDGVNSNWISGFILAWSGVAFHNAWITASADVHGDTWVVSSDQNSLYRSNSVDRTTGATGSPSYDQLTINYGRYQLVDSNQLSDWAVAEVIVYNRTLSLTEIQGVEAYLNRRYFPQGLEAMRLDMSVATTSTGEYSLNYNGTTDTVYILNTGSELWMLVGTGRENFNFTDAGNGTLSQITANRNSNTPYWASSAFVREVMASVSWTADTNGIMVQRFDGCNDSLRYKMSTNLQFNWSYFNPGNDVGNSPYSGIVTRYATTSWWSAATTYTTAATTYWTDTLSAGNAANDATRVFTWAWSGHNYVRGFSAGASVTTGYQYGTEAHAIQRVNCWARLK